jgi:hypothetical protein
MTNFSIRAVVFLGVCALAAYAYGDLYGYAGYYAIGGDVQGSEYTVSSSPPADPTNIDIGKSFGDTLGNVMSSGQVSVKAGNGKLGVSTEVDMSVGPPPNGPGSYFYKEASAEARGTAVLSDTLTVNDGSPGSQVVMHAQLMLNGIENLNVLGEFPQGMPNDDRIDGTAHITVSITGQFIAVSQGPNPHQLGDAGAAVEQDYSGGSSVVNAGGPPPSIIFLDETFVAGVPQTLAYTMSVDTYGAMQNYDDINKQTGSIFAVGDYADTLAWDGITSVTDTSGHPITGWTVTSASGFDYTQAVPEPSTAVLAVLGGIAVAIAARRRTSR